jgi:adenosylcobinamide-phosphate synthase
MKLSSVWTLVLAVLWDTLAGDPPNHFHPVAWMGQGIAQAERHAPRRSPPAEFLYGLGIVMGSAAVIGSIGSFVERSLASVPLVSIWLFKCTFASKSLASAAGEVQQALEENNLDEARRLASWHLVSRDTSALSAEHIAAATIESAPVFYYMLFGLPGALVYRFLNTADAMLGYHDEKREWLGKAAARLDDMANFIPARLTALLLLLAAKLDGKDAQRGETIWRRDAGKTASPNAGHPMSAMAGVLGVELEKKSLYRLGKGQRLPQPADIARSVRLMRWAVGLMTILTTVFLFTKSRQRKR